jgi:hypothetical protein
VLEIKLSFLRDQPSASSGYDNVLLGQGCRTPREAVINERGAMVE